MVQRSRVLEFRKGVPQGSVTGPLLFTKDFKSTLGNFITLDLKEWVWCVSENQEKVSSFSPWASVLCDSAEWVPSPERRTDWESQLQLSQPAAAEEWSWTEIS